MATKSSASVETPRSTLGRQLVEQLRRGERPMELDLRGCDLRGTSFDGLDLSRAKFGDADLRRCSFRGATLRGAVFFGADLQEACFDGADLEGADLDYANVVDVTFQGARLRHAVLPGRAGGRAQIEESVRTGARVRLAARRLEDEG
ncbi:MAG: hypothetical protein RLZZ299_1237 [Pseudomonadota bacterium]|jgi:uncharacterized protein YjbI with pentapeptide repeats